jgi:hypothetical protein
MRYMRRAGTPALESMEADPGTIVRVDFDTHTRRFCCPHPPDRLFGKRRSGADLPENGQRVRVPLVKLGQR